MDSPRSALRELDRRSADAIGREARLDLAFERRCGRTVLVRAYAEPPFRIGRVFDIGDAAYAIVACSGPGVFGGDTLRQTVHVGGGCRVVLTSQSALQAHPSPRPGPALVESRYLVADDGELHGHWDPVIPFAGARLAQRVAIAVGDGGRLYWSDAMMAGRVSRGEAWRFESLAHELTLSVAGSLAYLERYTLRPAERGVERSWMAGAARYFGTVLVHHADASREAAERWHRTIGGDNARSAADVVAPRLIAARIASVDGAPFSRARASYRAAALDDIFHAPELAGRK